MFNISKKIHEFSLVDVRERDRRGIKDSRKKIQDSR